MIWFHFVLIQRVDLFRLIQGLFLLIEISFVILFSSFGFLEIVVVYLFIIGRGLNKNNTKLINSIDEIRLKAVHFLLFTSANDCLLASTCLLRGGS